MPTAADIAAKRPDYLAELAEGTERFFLPRQTTCAWCGSAGLSTKFRTADLVQGKPGQFSLEECADCGYIFQNPRLSTEGLDFYYRDFYDGLGEESTAKMFDNNGSRRRFRRSAHALKRYGQPRRWLDVGTSHGHFCATAKEELPDTAFDGLDLSEAVELAVTEGRIEKAYRGFFVDMADEMKDSYDVVSMFHYMEHTLDPRAELLAARTALREGGHLLIEVPNPESPLGRLLGKRWMPWFQPQHLQFISMGLLQKELEGLGFTVVEASTREAHIPVDLVCAAWFLLSRILPADDAPWKPKPVSRVAKAVRVGMVVVALPVLFGAYGLDLLLAPLVRRSKLSNAYRVIARRG